MSLEVNQDKIDFSLSKGENKENKINHTIPIRLILVPNHTIPGKTLARCKQLLE
jgi:hypothetical protein